MTSRSLPRATVQPVHLDFTPIPRRYRHDGWTPERQRAFIAALAETGSVKHAARRVGMSTDGAYQLRRQKGADSFAASVGLEQVDPGFFFTERRWRGLETALRAQNPTLAEQLEVIWQSPPIPEGGIVVREDLDPAIKEKIRSFFLTYGQGDGVEAERQRRVLAGLRYSRFNAADDDYLDPVREMMADQRLTAARAARDAAGVAEAEQELQRLRAKREVQP